MVRPKMTIRFADEAQLEELHRRAERAGYRSLTEYLIDSSLNDGRWLKTDRQVIAELAFEVRYLSNRLQALSDQISDTSLFLVEKKSLNTLINKASKAVALVGKVLGLQESCAKEDV